VEYEFELVGLLAGRVWMLPPHFALGPGQIHRRGVRLAREALDGAREGDPHQGTANRR
jgi:hypothetical protein